jgi:hypothetical protein
MKTRIWTGRIVKGLGVTLLIFNIGVLWTAFLGGATASLMRVGESFLSHLLFPSYVGLFLWSGLCFAATVCARG